MSNFQILFSITVLFFFFILFFVFGYDNDDAVDFSLLGLVGEEEDEKLIVVVEELILDFNFLLEMFGYNLFKKNERSFSLIFAEFNSSINGLGQHGILLHLKGHIRGIFRKCKMICSTCLSFILSTKIHF